jgi:hypothetical protein
LSSPRWTKILREKYLEQGVPVPVAVETILDQISKEFNKNVFDQPQTAESTEELEHLVATTESLADNTPVESTSLVQLEGVVDFVSDKVTKFMALFAKVPFRKKSPTSEWTAEQLQLVQDKVRERFRRLGLPLKITQALSLRDNTTSNIFASVPNALSMLINPAVRRVLGTRMKATLREEHALTGVFSFVQEFASKFNDIHLGLLNDKDNPNSPFRQEKTGVDQIGIINRVREYVLQWMMDPETGVLNENIIAIMAMEVGEWMATAGASTLNNNKETINALIGLDSTSDLGDSPEARKVFGNGTLISNVATQIGERVLRQANLQFSGQNVDGIMRDSLHSSIGLMAISVAQQMDYIKVTPVTAEVRNKFLEINPATDEEVGDETLNLISIKSENQTNTGKYTPSSRSEALRHSFTGAKRILGQLFSVVSYVRGPLLEEIPTGPTSVSRGNTSVPQKLTDWLTRSSAYIWKPNTSATEVIGWFAEADFLSSFMGSRDIEKAHDENKDSVAGKNLGNKRSLDQLNEWIEENGNAGFRFAYKVIRSGRIYIDSNTLNPQQDKLHRFMLAMEAWKFRINTVENAADLTGKTGENFLIAVALSLDIDTSNLGRAAVLQQVRDKLNEADTRAAIDLLKAGPKDGHFKSEAEPGQLSEVAIIAKPLHDGEEIHGLAGLKAVADIERAFDKGQKTITLAFPMETDGKTNGLAAGLLQTPPLNSSALEVVKDLLRKVTRIIIKERLMIHTWLLTKWKMEMLFLSICRHQRVVVIN